MQILVIPFYQFEVMIVLLLVMIRKLEVVSRCCNFDCRASVTEFESPSFPLPVWWIAVFQLHQRPSSEGKLAF